MPRITRRRLLAATLAIPPLLLTCGQPDEAGREAPPPADTAVFGVGPPPQRTETAPAPVAPPTREPVELWHFAWDDPLERRLWFAIRQQLEQDLPHLLLNQEFYQRPLEEVTALSVAAGLPPDAASIQDVYFPHWVERNLYVNLQNFVSDWLDETTQDDFPAAALGAFRYYPEARRAGLGDFYGMPWRSSPRALFINENMLREQGLSGLVDQERWTLATAQEAGRQIADFGVENRLHQGAMGFPDAWFHAVPWLWSGGGDVLDETGSTSTLATPNVARVLQALQDWRHTLRIAPRVGELGADAYVEHFAQHRLAMFLGSPRDMLRLQESDVRWRAEALYPDDGNESRMLTLYDGLAVVTGAQQVDAAWEFMAWLLGPAAQERVLEGGQALPVRSGALAASSIAPHFVETVLNESNTQHLLPIAPTFALYSPAMAHYYHLMMNGGHAPVPETLAKLHALLNFILERRTLPSQ